MTEVELKFLSDVAGLKRLRGRLKSEGLVARMPRPRALRSIYFDTADHALRREGIALRLRRDGRRWVQTVKAKAPRAGLSQTAEEAECAAPGGRLRLQAIPDAGLRERVTAKLNGHAPEAIAETAIRRAAIDVALDDGGVAEIALDQGAIIAGAHARDFCEIELELKSGGLAALYRLAQRLFPDGGLRLSRLSKAERGFLLADEGRIGQIEGPRKAAQVPLRPEQSAETAARDVLRECFDQIAANAECLRDGEGAEGPHQLRVGLRRLRSAFVVFRPVIGNAEMERLAGEARWLGREVGRLRDLDVALDEIIGPAAASAPGETGFAALETALTRARGQTRGEVRGTLRGPRAQAFLFDLARFFETRGWLRPDDFGQSVELAAPVSGVAQRALKRRWKKVRDRARNIETLDVEARHELRKELKKLRYAVEFFAPLYPGKRVAPFAKSLKRLQNVFGDLNDAAMAQSLLLAEAAPGRRDADAQRAAGYILGRCGLRAELAWDDALALWQALAAVKPFWK